MNFASRAPTRNALLLQRYRAAERPRSAGVARQNAPAPRAAVPPLRLRPERPKSFMSPPSAAPSTALQDEAVKEYWKRREQMPTPPTSGGSSSTASTRSCWAEEAPKRPNRQDDALAVRRRMLDDSLSVRERLAWLPDGLHDAIGARTLNAAGVRRHYKLLSMLIHPDKHADEPDSEVELWTEAYKRLGNAKSELLGAMGCLPSSEGDDDDAEALELLAAGRYGEATARYRRKATEIARELGAQHVRSFRIKLRLANVLRTSTNQTGEAEVLLRYLHKAAKRTFGVENLDYLHSARELGMLLQDKGDLDNAEPLLKEGADGLTALKGEGDAGALASRTAYAALLHAKGDYAAAAERLKEVCATTREALGEEAPETHRCRDRYSDCLQRLGRSAEECITDASAYNC